MKKRSIGFSGFSMGDKKRGRFEDDEEKKRPPPAVLLGRATEEKEEAGGTGEAAEEAEVDPLDAFMEGIRDTVNKEKAGLIKPAQTKVILTTYPRFPFDSPPCCSALLHTLALYI